MPAQPNAPQWRFPSNLGYQPMEFEHPPLAPSLQALGGAGSGQRGLPGDPGQAGQVGQMGSPDTIPGLPGKKIPIGPGGELPPFPTPNPPAPAVPPAAQPPAPAPGGPNMGQIMAQAKAAGQLGMQNVAKPVENPPFITAMIEKGQLPKDFDYEKDIAERNRKVYENELSRMAPGE